MDTVEVKIEGRFVPSITKTILRRIVGKPLRFHEGKLSGKEGRKVKPRSGMSHAVSGLIEGKHVYASWRDNIGPLSTLLIHFELSTFERWNQVLGWIERNFKPHKTQILHAKVSRLDLCVDVAVPIQAVSQQLYKPRSRRVQKWRSQTETYYIGAYPKQFCAYSKVVPLHLIDYMPRNMSAFSNPHPCTRIEVRLYGRNLPIKHLIEMPKAAKSAVFSELRVLNASQPMVTSQLSRTCLHRIMAFQFRLSQVGFQQSRKEFNQQRNFHRDIGKHLIEVEENYIQLAWHQRLARFFRKNGCPAGEVPLFPTRHSDRINNDAL